MNALKTEESGLSSFFDVVAEDLHQIATLHSSEPTREVVNSLKEIGFPNSLGLKLSSKEAREAIAVFMNGVDNMPTPLTDEILDVLACDYADIYLNHTFCASPLESVWLDDDGLIYQEPMFQVRKYYEKHDLFAGDWRKRSDDHIVLQLDFISYLLEVEFSYERLQEIAQFMDEHLLRWLPQFAERASERCATLFFSGVVKLTAAYCEELRQILEKVLDTPRPSKEEVDRRMKPEKLIQIGESPYVPGVGPTV